jgi:glutaredoxin
MAFAQTAPSAQARGKRQDTTRQTAILYRMVTPDHRCPWGLRSKDLLQRQGFRVDDHILATRAETDAFMEAEGVDTTPQTYIAGQRVGGYEDLRRHFGLKVADPDAETYAPVIALFASALVMALALTYGALGTIWTPQTVLWFGALAMCLYAVQKFRDLDSFATRFLGYDILARQFVPYGWVYPFAEFAAGLAMLAGVLMVPAGLVALFIGTIGAVSVVQAVWVEGRELKCACVGGAGNVPLGPVSLIENVGMMAMGLWMLLGVASLS